MASWRAATDSLTQARDAPTGELRIAAPLGLGLHIVPGLASVLSTWLQPRLRLLVSDEMVDLIDVRVDLALRIGNMAESGWTDKHLRESHTNMSAYPRPHERSVG